MLWPIIIIIIHTPWWERATVAHTCHRLELIILFSFAHYSILLFSLYDLHFVPIIPYVWWSATQREDSTYLVDK